MATAESNPVHKLKRSLYWLVLVFGVAGFANWTERRLDENRAQEIRATRGAGAEKRIAGSAPQSSADLLMQLRYASAMLDPSKTQTRRQSSFFDDNQNDSTNREDSRGDQGFRSLNPRPNSFSQGNSQPFGSPYSLSSPYTSPTSSFGRSSTYGQYSNFGQPSSLGQSNVFGQPSSSRTNPRNQSDTSSGLLGPDNPN